MGSTIETSICFSLVLLILTVFIVFPMDTWHKCIDIGVNGVNELKFHLENDNVVSTKRIASYDSKDTCPELINTAIFGIIDSISIAKG